MQKIMLMLVIILLSAFCTDIIRSDEYSSDFEQDIMAWEDNVVLESQFSNSYTNMHGENSPGLRYYEAKKRAKYDKVVDYLYRRQKFEYRPYSPTVHQKRRQYDPRDVDWDDPWYD